MYIYIYTCIATSISRRHIYIIYLPKAYVAPFWRLRKYLVNIWPMRIYTRPSPCYESSLGSSLASVGQLSADNNCFLSHYFVASYCRITISYYIIISYYHIILSYHIIISYYHIILSYHIIISRSNCNNVR